MFKKRSFIAVTFVLGITGVIGLLTLGPTNVLSKVQSLIQDSVNTDSQKNLSNEIVFDGDHYKLAHDIIHTKSHLYIALPDLMEILPIDVTEKNSEIVITYEHNRLAYKNKEVQNSTLKEDEVSTYEINDGVIYLPDRHIEKFLGVKVSYYLDKKTKTVALMSPVEQKKPNYDRNIGTTIFLHKKGVPLEKYEPRSGLYLGGYVLQDEFINMSMERFNEIMDKKHVTYFKYVGYGKPFPKDWVDEVIAAGGFPHIAWEPNEGLNEVQDDAYLREFAKDAGKYNVPILLRYASEMNGTWTFYSGNADLYIEKWKLVHDVMEKEAPNVMMLWNVFTMPEQTIAEFYPGDDYVDYVGVNIYNVVYHNDRLDARSDFEDPLRLLDYVYNTYSARKPIVIGEFGATNYNVTDGLNHVDFAVEKISRMYKYLPELYPRVKMIYYFDVNNLVNAPEGRKINNYSITENERITDAYVTYIEQPEYISELQVGASSSADETFSYRDFLFYYKGELFVDYQFIESYLGMEVSEIDDGVFIVRSKGETYSFKKETLTIDKAAFFEKRDIQGVPLISILNLFEYRYEMRDGDLHIYE